MSRLVLWTLTAISSIAVTTSARAATIIDLTLDSNFPADYALYSWVSTTGVAENNLPADPYITYLTGGTYNNTEVYSFCFDFDAPTTVGKTYPGSFETFTDPSDLEATYLMNDLNAAGLLNASLAVRGAITTAIWEIMNPSSATKVSPFPSDPAAQPYEAAAAQAVANGWWTSADAAQFPIWVPQDPSIQRFGIIDLGSPPVAMPEPSSPALMVLGLAGLAILGRKRWARGRLT